MREWYPSLHSYCLSLVVESESEISFTVTPSPLEYGVQLVPSHQCVSSSQGLHSPASHIPTHGAHAVLVLFGIVSGGHIVQVMDPFFEILPSSQSSHSAEDVRTPGEDAYFPAGHHFPGGDGVGDPLSSYAFEFVCRSSSRFCRLFLSRSPSFSSAPTPSRKTQPLYK